MLRSPDESKRRLCTSGNSVDTALAALSAFSNTGRLAVAEERYNTTNCARSSICMSLKDVSTRLAPVNCAKSKLRTQPLIIFFLSLLSTWYPKGAWCQRFFLFQPPPCPTGGGGRRSKKKPPNGYKGRGNEELSIHCTAGVSLDPAGERIQQCGRKSVFGTKR